MSEGRDLSQEMGHCGRTAEYLQHLARGAADMARRCGFTDLQRLFAMAELEAQLNAKPGLTLVDMPSPRELLEQRAPERPATADELFETLHLAEQGYTQLAAFMKEHGLKEPFPAGLMVCKALNALQRCAEERQGAAA